MSSPDSLESNGLFGSDPSCGEVAQPSHSLNGAQNYFCEAFASARRHIGVGHGCDSRCSTGLILAGTGPALPSPALPSPARYKTPLEFIDTPLDHRGTARERTFHACVVSRDTPSAVRSSSALLNTYASLRVAHLFGRFDARLRVLRWNAPCRSRAHSARPSSSWIRKLPGAVLVISWTAAAA
jgi:hypothetical protein